MRHTPAHLLKATPRCELEKKCEGLSGCAKGDSREEVYIQTDKYLVICLQSHTFLETKLTKY